MKAYSRPAVLALAALAMGIFTTDALQAADAGFHGAPAEAKQQDNPAATDKGAVEAGHGLFAKRCASCHGKNAQGTGPIPSLREGPTQAAADGEIFWYITKGEVDAGMPSWAALPVEQRWQIVRYVKSLSTGGSASTSGANPAEATVTSRINAPPPPAPFVDFRSEAPGKIHKITERDLPAPHATKSANNGADLVARPNDAWPKALPGFKVEQFATNLDNPRELRTAPNGDVFLAEMEPGNIKVFRGVSSEGKPETSQVFASGLKGVFGIAFYPPGPDPKYVYVGSTTSVVRFAYKNGDLKASGNPEHIADLPAGGHSTRDIQFTPDGKKMWVAVGSHSNNDDTDTSSAEKNRADILEFNPDGSGMRVYAYGIRNPVGLAVDPKTHQLWCSVNERDTLGDNLVPDYITHVEDGGFYGWPWWYMGANQDPKHKGKHPELRDKAIVPDVLLQPHNASLQLTVYDGKQFPKEYEGDIFAAEHGSWNKAVRAGYEVIRVPLHHEGKASGEYEDFLTGFVTADGNVWGRPVGVTTAKDGSLLVSDDGSNTIWRVSYTGK